MASAEPRSSSPPYSPSDMGSDDDGLDLDSSDDDTPFDDATENMLAEAIARNKKPRAKFLDSSSDSGDSSDELDMLMMSSDEEGGGTSEARQAAEQAEANEMVAELRTVASCPEEPLAQPSLKRPRHSGGPSAAAAAAADAGPPGPPLPPRKDLPLPPKLKKLTIAEMSPHSALPSPQQAPREYDPRTSTEQEKAALNRTLTQVLGTDLKCPLTLSSFAESGSLPVVVRTAGADYHVSAVGAVSEMWPQFIEWFLHQETHSEVRCYGPMFHAVRLYCEPEYLEEARSLGEVDLQGFGNSGRMSEGTLLDFASLHVPGDHKYEHLVSILVQVYGPLPTFSVHRPYHAESYVTDTDRALVTMLEHLHKLMLDLRNRGLATGVGYSALPSAARLVEVLFCNFQLVPLSFAAGGGATPLSLREMLAENLPAGAAAAAAASSLSAPTPEQQARLIQALGPVFRHNSTLDTCVANLSGGGGGGALHRAAEVGVMLDARGRFCFRKANRALEGLHKEWIAYAHARWLTEDCAHGHGQPVLTRQQQTDIYRQIAVDDARIAAIQSHAFIVKHNLKTRRGTLPPALRGVVTPLADTESPPCAGCGVGMPRHAMGSWARWCRHGTKYGIPEAVAMQCVPSQPVYCLACSQSRTAFQCSMLLRGCSMEPYAKAAVDRAEAADGADPLPPLLDWNRISLTEAIHSDFATKTTASAGPDTERIRRRVQEALAAAAYHVTGQIHTAAVAVRFSLPQHPGSDLDLERIVRKANLKEKAHLAKLNRIFLLPYSTATGSYAHTPFSLADTIVGSKVFAYFCAKPTPKYISATREYCSNAFLSDSDLDSDTGYVSGDEDDEHTIRMPKLQVEVFLLKTNTTPEKVSKIITSHFQTLPALAMAKHKYDRRMLPRILGELDNPAAFGPPSMAARNRGKLDSVAKMLAAHRDGFPSRQLRAHFDHQGDARAAYYNPFEYDAHRLAGLAKVSAVTILKTGDMRSF